MSILIKGLDIPKSCVKYVGDLIECECIYFMDDDWSCRLQANSKPFPDEDGFKEQYKGCPIIEIDQEDEEWQTGKPKERGKYLVTMEYWVGDKERYVDVAYYGIMYGEKHECFYQTDSEWGDCKLDGVLAWMPLPEPWKGE